MSDTEVAIDNSWNLVVKSPTGDQHSVLTLKSNGGVLTGSSFSETSGNQEIEDGTYDGETLKWKSKVTKPMKITVTFVATLDENNNINGYIKAMMTKIKFSGTPIGK